MFGLVVLVAAGALASTDSEVGVVQDGHGCEQKLNQWCPLWKTESKERCVACCVANLSKLEPNCNLSKALGKCGTNPG